MVFAALGATEKKPDSGDVRIIFDGTHGVLTNGRIRITDRQRFPRIGDIQAVLHMLDYWIKDSGMATEPQSERLDEHLRGRINNTITCGKSGARATREHHLFYSSLKV